MKKLLAVHLLFLSVIYVGDLCAHAVVTDHSLKIERPKINQAKTVDLVFNSKIELGLSEVYLVSKGDKQTRLVINKGEKQGSILVSIPPLSQGEYALIYKIFASDGHLTEDVIHFTVTP
jgi:copper resistance protein C